MKISVYKKMSVRDDPFRHYTTAWAFAPFMKGQEPFKTLIVPDGCTVIREGTKELLRHPDPEIQPATPLQLLLKGWTWKSTHP